MLRERVNELRKRRGWTHGKLADYLGLDRAGVTSNPEGRRIVSLDEALAYCAALGQGGANHPANLSPSCAGCHARLKAQERRRAA